MLTQIIIGLLSFVFVTLTRMQSLKKYAEVANVEFKPKKYFEKEWIGLLASIVPIIMWMYLYPEVAAKYPAIQGWLTTSFAVMGACGSWIFQKFLGSTKKWIHGIVDIKTDIADSKTEQAT